jgi:hypothetical protein
MKPFIDASAMKVMVTREFSKFNSIFIFTETDAAFRVFWRERAFNR